MPTFLTLDQIRQKVDDLMAVIDAPRNLQPTYGYSDQMATPEIDVDANGYLYIVCERGHEYAQLASPDLDPILYEIFDGITFHMACKYALHHRAWAKDSRRLIFATQLKLLEQLSPAWRERCARHQDEVLQQYPYSDE